MPSSGSLEPRAAAPPALLVWNECRHLGTHAACSEVPAFVPEGEPDRASIGARRLAHFAKAAQTPARSSSSLCLLFHRRFGTAARQARQGLHFRGSTKPRSVPPGDQSLKGRRSWPQRKTGHFSSPPASGCGSAPMWARRARSDIAKTCSEESDPLERWELRVMVAQWAVRMGTGFRLGGSGCFGRWARRLVALALAGLMLALVLVSGGVVQRAAGAHPAASGVSGALALASPAVVAGGRAGDDLGGARLGCSPGLPLSAFGLGISCVVVECWRGWARTAGLISGRVGCRCL